MIHALTLATALLIAALAPLRVSARADHAASGYHPSVSGKLIGYRLAGIEPDGDPLDQIALQTTLSPSATVPSMRLFVNAYLENFKPDTTPILPDLLNRNKQAQNLGGFLQGKALITDNAGNVLYIGAFLAEAFLNNSNHAVMQLDGGSAAASSHARLQGTFSLNKQGALHGAFQGRLTLPVAALRQIERYRKATIQSAQVKSILDAVKVKPAAMVGRKTARSQTVPLHTGYANTTPARTVTTHSTRRVSQWTIIAGAGAVVCFVTAALLFIRERRAASTRRPPPAEAAG